MFNQCTIRCLQCMPMQIEWLLWGLSIIRTPGRLPFHCMRGMIDWWYTCSGITLLAKQIEANTSGNLLVDYPGWFRYQLLNLGMAIDRISCCDIIEWLLDGVECVGYWCRSLRSPRSCSTKWAAWFNNIKEQCGHVHFMHYGIDVFHRYCHEPQTSLALNFFFFFHMLVDTLVQPLHGYDGIIAHSIPLSFLFPLVYFIKTTKKN